MQRLLLFGLSGLLAGALGFVALTPQAGLLVIKFGGYWILLVTFFVFAWNCLHVLQSGDGDFWSAVRTPKVLIVCLAAFAFLATREERFFKVVMDEPVLVGTSRMMSEQRVVMTPMSAQDIYGAFTILDGYVDKRPNFFPLLVSLVHDLTGYRKENAYIVNTILAVAVVLLMFALGYSFGGRDTGVVAVLSLSTIPLVSQVTAGAGFELLNLTMILAVTILGVSAFRTGSSQSIGALALGGVLLSQCRYESVIFVVPVGSVILLTWAFHRKLIVPWALIAAPLLMTLYVWQNRVFELNQGLWQLHDKPGADRAFSWVYFSDNVGHAINHFFNFSDTGSNSQWLAVAGFLALPFAVLAWAKESGRYYRERHPRVVLVVFGASLIGLLLLIMCYFWGQLDDPVVVRLGLPINLLLILAILFAFDAFGVGARGWRWIQAGLGAYLFAWTLPVASKHYYTLTYIPSLQVRWQQDFIDRHRYMNYLMVTDAPMFYIINDRQSISTVRANHRVQSIKFHHDFGTHEEILFANRIRINPDTRQEEILDRVKPSSAFILETLEEKRLTPLDIIRISRLVDFDLEQIEDEQVHTPPVREDRVREDRDFMEQWARELP